jgi:hypothetical protein
MIVSHDEVYVWDNLFFMGPWFHLSGYINSQSSRMWCAENLPALQDNPLQLSKSVFVCVWGLSRK